MMTEITEEDALIEALEEALESEDLFFSYSSEAASKGRQFILNKIQKLKQEKKG